MKKLNIFDVRTIIGSLLLIYGVILLLAATQTTAAEKARANGTNANLWVGLALVVVGAAMMAWAVLRPLEIDEEQVEQDKREVDEAAGRPRDEGGAA
jgi:ABC-type cobalamin transport system permease subunit